MLILLSFILGLFIGSFLLVVIYRLPLNEQFITGRSRCDYCHKFLCWYDLIPVLSYFLTSGKCRYCHKQISIIYPFFELLSGILFSLTLFLLFPLSIVSIIFYFFMTSILLVIFFIDLFYQIIPFKIVIPSILFVWLYNLLYSPILSLNYLFAALSAGLFFFILFTLTRGKGMGFGDVIFAFFMGSLLGFPRIIIALYIAFIVGALVGIIYVVAKRKKIHGTAIPFGPFLAIGTYIGIILPMPFINLIFYYFHLNYLFSML